MRIHDFVKLTEVPDEPWRLAQGKNISMPGELWGRVDAVAEALEVSRSMLMQMLVKDAIEDLERDLAENVKHVDDWEDLGVVLNDDDRRAVIRSGKKDGKKASQTDIEEFAPAQRLVIPRPVLEV